MTEQKHENFRRYLEENGVMEAIIHAIVSLHEEQQKPSDPANYIKQLIGDAKGPEAEDLICKNKKLKEEIEALTKEIAELEAKK